VVPQRMMQSGFQFAYPELPAALRHILSGPDHIPEGNPIELCEPPSNRP
jgi:hypothetical protein